MVIPTMRVRLAREGYMVAGKKALFAAAMAVTFVSSSGMAAVGSVWDVPGVNNTWSTNLADANWNGGFSWTNGSDAFFVNSPGEAVTISGTVVASGVTINAAGYSFSGGTLKLNSGSTLTAAEGATISSNLDAAGTTLQVVYGHTLTVSGDLSAASGPGAAITKTGEGTLYLTGKNSPQFQGSWIIDEGILKVNNPANLNGGIIADAVKFTGDATLHVVDTYTYDEVGAPDPGVSPKGITLQDAAATIQVDGLVGFRGGITGTGSLTKTGAGRFIVDGTNTYDGETFVDEGNLQLNGTLASSDITVASGATLSGVGSASNTTVLLEGILSPGKDAATLVDVASLTLETGAQTWAAGGTYEVTVTNATGGLFGYGISDLVTVSDLEVEDGFNINMVGTPASFNPASSYSWLIAKFDSFDGDVGYFNIGSTFAASNLFSAFTTSEGGANYLGISYNAVPEATTLMLGLVAVTPLVMHRRRSKKMA